MAQIFQHHRQVEFSETDMAGIVHFSNYFRWIEAAENALLAEVGVPLVTHLPGGFRGWPRARASAKYQAPLFYPDRICVELQIAQLKDRAIDYAATIWAVREGERLKAATARLTTVYVEKTSQEAPMRSLALPEAFRQRLAPYLMTDNVPENG